MRRFLSTIQAAPKVKKEPKTPLVDIISSFINMNGAIPIAQYMRLCLTHPQHGYYNRKDTIGSRGDFITSPEISQLFGEMIGVWSLTQLQHAQKPHDLIELGPGKGTLLADILRTMSQFPRSRDYLNTINLIEKSTSMIEKQITALKSVPGVLVESGTTSSPRLSWQGVKINWAEDLSLVSSNHPPLVLAHEFFDALPIHQFCRKDGVLKEVLIDIDDSNDTNTHFRYVLSKSQTPAALACQSHFGQEPESETYEWSPESGHVMNDICQRISQNEAGVALVIDYGRDYLISQSFRGISNHKFVDPLSLPGIADLTADVDFESLSSVSIKHKGLRQYSLLTQREFLKRMNADVRQEMLLKRAKPEEMEALRLSYNRLVDNSAMGSVYKFWMTRYESAGSSYPFTV